MAVEGVHEVSEDLHLARGLILMQQKSATFVTWRRLVALADRVCPPALVARPGRAPVLHLRNGTPDETKPQAQDSSSSARRRHSLSEAAKLRKGLPLMNADKGEKPRMKQPTTGSVGARYF